MTILKTFPEQIKEDKKLVYALTKGKSTSVKLIGNGTQLHIDCFILYEDMNANTGEVNEVLAFKSGNDFYTTISPVFKKSFLDMFEVLGDEVEKIEIQKRLSKSNREYVDCQLVY